jgi:hypothetical protein
VVHGSTRGAGRGRGEHSGQGEILTVEVSAGPRSPWPDPLNHEADYSSENNDSIAVDFARET